MSKQNKKYNAFSCIPICYRISHAITIVRITNAVILAAIPSIQIIVLANFIDQSLASLNRGASFRAAIPSLCAVVAIIGYKSIMPKVVDLLWCKLNLALMTQTSAQYIEKCASLSYHIIEDPTKVDLLNRVGEQHDLFMSNMLNAFLSVFTLFVQLFSVFVLIFTKSWWVALVIAAFSIPMYFLSLKAGKQFYETDVIVTKWKRLFGYFSSLLISRGSVEERTLFQYTEPINEKWLNSFEQFRKENFKTNRKNNFRMELGSIITTLISILIIVVLLDPLFRGVISIGIFMSLIVVIYDLIEIISWHLTDIVNKVTYNAHFLKELNIFYDLPEEKGALDIPSPPEKFESLEFRNVVFRYPSMKDTILKGISFTIQAGKHYAFVGANGAGKTTIVKLITGLYREYDGEIFLNGKELHTYSMAEIKAMFSIVFQDFARYEIAMEENVSIGNVNQKNKTACLEAIQQVGLDNVAGKLPYGIQTVLGKTLVGSHDLSGGEWQRLALARALYSNGNIRILDEPTAALDPLMENQVYENFQQHSKNITSILISHRLGSTKIADEILVVDKGVIEEQGSHEQLMKNNGLYATMYKSQRKWYE